MIGPAFLFDLIVVLALVGLAAASVFSRDLTQSVILLMVFGLVMALAWARLRAPDIAITEVALGSGLTGALLLFAAARFRSRPDHEHADHKRDEGHE